MKTGCLYFSFRCFVCFRSLLVYLKALLRRCRLWPGTKKQNLVGVEVNPRSLWHVMLWGAPEALAWSRWMLHRQGQEWQLYENHLHYSKRSLVDSSWTPNLQLPRKKRDPWNSLKLEIGKPNFTTISVLQFQLLRKANLLKSSFQNYE